MEQLGSPGKVKTVNLDNQGCADSNATENYCPGSFDLKREVSDGLVGVWLNRVTGCGLRLVGDITCGPAKMANPRYASTISVTCEDKKALVGEPAGVYFENSLVDSSVILQRNRSALFLLVFNAENIMDPHVVLVKQPRVGAGNIVELPNVREGNLCESLATELTLTVPPGNVALLAANVAANPTVSSDCVHLHIGAVVLSPEDFKRLNGATGITSEENLYSRVGSPMNSAGSSRAETEVITMPLSMLDRYVADQSAEKNIVDWKILTALSVFRVREQQYFIGTGYHPCALAIADKYDGDLLGLVQEMQTAASTEKYADYRRLEAMVQRARS
jgi:hypothetical protein